MTKKPSTLKPFEKRSAKNPGNEDTPPEKAKVGGKTSAFGGKPAKPFTKKGDK